MIYTVLVLNVCLLVCGQVFFKRGLEAVGGINLNTLVPLFLNPWILVGLVLYVLATLLWFYVLSKVPLSLAYPLQSLSYVLGLFVSRYILHESIPWTRWTGTLIILAGVALVAYQPRAGV